MEEKEIARKEKELFGTVRLPAEAEAFRTQTIAEGHRCVVDLILQRILFPQDFVLQYESDRSCSCRS